MAIRDEFQSEALRVNLERTRVDDITYPENQAWLLGTAEKAFGVRKRLEVFLREHHHPYSNMEQSVELMRDTVLTDLWFFLGLDESHRALRTLLDLFVQILERDLTLHLRERAIITLLEFMGRLVGHWGDDPSELDLEILDGGLEILKVHSQQVPEIQYRSSWFLKTAVPGLVTMPGRDQSWIVLLTDALRENLRFWRESTQYESWVASWELDISDDFTRLVDTLGTLYFDQLDARLASSKSWQELKSVPDFVKLSDHFRNARESVSSPLNQAYYILYLLNQSGMAYVRDPLLWDLNRIIQRIGDELPEDKIIGFIDQLFDYFRHLQGNHLGTVLDCILTLGHAVYERNSVRCIDHFQDQVIEFGFVGPDCPVNRQSWQVEVNPNHIKNIRIWMQIIECNPALSKKLIAALIVNLKIKGMFISDTDLFQRDVTRLLNSQIENPYMMIRELCRLFPVYFNEIGAEGLLREVTTAIDEYSGRHDRLIHYLRKQIHTESNATHIRLVEEIARYWHSGERTVLQNLVPVDVALALEPMGIWYEPASRTMKMICDHFQVTPRESLLLDETTVRDYLEQLPAGGKEIDCYRIVRLISLYQLLRDKYTLGDHQVIAMLKQNPITRQKAVRLESLLSKGNPDAALHFVFSILQQLRKIILNPEPGKPDESIYQKRHIAVGIPSMYGRYREPKFEALGLSFRLENLASKLMDQILDKINLRYISAWTLRRIAQVLSHFQKGLRLSGIVHEGFNTNVRMLYYSLNTTAFSIDQYVNLFQFMMRNVRQIIQTHFVRPNEKVLREILLRQHYEDFSKDPNEDQVRQLHGRTESFYRESITSAFLVSRLDTYIAKILDTLNRMVNTLTPDIIDNVMTYDPDLMTSPIHQSNHELDSQIFLGAKGYFLKRLYSYKFPVPPGFILTTEMFRRRVAISRYPEMSREVFKLVKGHIRELEGLTGKVFGDPRKPLLLSVRSGAAISLPGAMNTFLNVGMNDHIVEVLSQQDNYGWTSWDCYRRFLQSWGMAYGITRDEFDSVIIQFKKRFGVTEKIMFEPDQMRTIAFAYKDVLQVHGVKFEEDPFRQVMQAIMVVMDSWNTSRAQIYRERLRIAPDWGTAVILQQMVLGNLNIDSGTGVVFTHDPFINEPGVFLYGDFTMCSQGEDVVAGLVHTLPISERQRRRSPGVLDLSLEKDFPLIFKTLMNYASRLIYTHGFGHQEIEFTFESPRSDDLHILQTRDHSWGAANEEIPVFRDPELKSNELGVGIGISKGAMNGVVVFDEQDLEEFSKEKTGNNRILVRPDTVPDDIGMIFECNGLLTARGGAASHAAVTAVRLGKTCVVNCRMLTVLDKEKRCIINGIEFRPGDKIAIDGRSGHIYKGNHPIGMAAPLELP